MPKKIPIPVVCAVIEDGSGRVLVAQRPAHKHLGLKWEFPGGKVEPAESPEAALARELREELGIEIDAVRALPRFRHDYGSVVIEMFPFVCRLAPGSRAPHLHEHIAVQWVAPSALAGIDLAPADFPVVASYRATVLNLTSMPEAAVDKRRMRLQRLKENTARRQPSHPLPS